MIFSAVFFRESGVDIELKVFSEELLERISSSTGYHEAVNRNTDCSSGTDLEFENLSETATRQTIRRTARRPKPWQRRFVALVPVRDFLPKLSRANLPCWRGLFQPTPHDKCRSAKPGATGTTNRVPKCVAALATSRETDKPIELRPKRCGERCQTQMNLAKEI
jgi:hypothetical protein